MDRKQFVYDTHNYLGGLYGTTTDIYMLPVGTKFEVINGLWSGEIVEIDSSKHLKMDNGTIKKLEENQDYGLVIEVMKEEPKDDKRDLYLHYKGNLYEKIMEAMHTEDEEVLVIYKDEKGSVWARPKEMFEGSLEYEGKLVKRFSKVNS